MEIQSKLQTLTHKHLHSQMLLDSIHQYQQTCFKEMALIDTTKTIELIQLEESIRLEYDEVLLLIKQKFIDTRV